MANAATILLYEFVSHVASMRAEQPDPRKIKRKGTRLVRDFWGHFA